MTESSSSPLKYFKTLEGSYQNTKPCIPDKEMIIEIPQNLPQGTIYNIGLDSEEDKSIGDKLNIISQKLNNIIEIESLLVLKQIPELLQSLTQQKILLEKYLKIKTIKEEPLKKPLEQKPLTIKPPFTW